MFSVERHDADEAVRLIVEGELDMDAGPRLQEEIERAYAAAPARLVLDLRGVTFFDSTGLQLVLDAEVRCRDAGRELLVLPGRAGRRGACSSWRT